MRKKPVASHQFSSPQADCWITSVQSLYNSDAIVTATSDGTLSFTRHQPDPAPHKLNIDTPLSLANDGLISDIQIHKEGKFIAYTLTDSLKFGRWITSPKTRHKIKIVSF